jgi:hypothetical protein
MYLGIKVRKRTKENASQYLRAIAYPYRVFLATMSEKERAYLMAIKKTIT